MFNFKNKILLKIGLIVLILIILAYAYSSLTENKKFTDSVISFDYPCFYIPQHGESSGSTMQKVAYFTSGDPFNSQNILVTKNKTAISASKLRDDAILTSQNRSDCKILSKSTVTNPNGIILETIVITVVVKGKPSINYLMSFKINDTVYAIGVYGPESNGKRISNTANIISKSLNIT